jgi:N-acyl-D-amino-acid deacylase
MISALCAVVALSSQAGSGLVIQNGIVYDGTGSPGKREDIRVVGDTIREVGKVRVRPGDRIIDAHGLAVSPGFIDAHSHADGGIFEDPDAETHIRQGVTTSFVGEDGFSSYPLGKWFDKLRAQPAALNFGSFVGEGTIRKLVMGNETRRPTTAELNRMREMIDQEMRSGARGLSTGLEYEPNRYADTDEVVACAAVAAKRHGIYISHVRNEDNNAFKSFNELAEVGRRAHMPAEINHIKIASTRVWHRADEVRDLMASAAKQHEDITADVYPYLFWQSTIRVVIMTEQFDDRAQWEQGIKDVGGPQNIRLTSYSVEPTWAGKTLADISATTGKDPITLAQEIIANCYGPGKKGSESVCVTAMSEDDLKKFIANPKVSFCSDGGLHGTHPRGAGSFPRILGVYVRAQKVIPLAEAIRKMTSQPAWRFGLADRGRIAAGMKADITIFDPAKVIDTATVEKPESPPIGIPTVIVNGVPVLLDGVVTHAHPGRPLPMGHYAPVLTTHVLEPAQESAGSRG